MCGYYASLADTVRNQLCLIRMQIGLMQLIMIQVYQRSTLVKLIRMQVGIYPNSRLTNDYLTDNDTSLSEKDACLAD